MHSYTEGSDKERGKKTCGYSDSARGTWHLRLCIDFHVTIARTLPDDGMKEPDPIYHTRQARLLAAVKCRSAVLK